MGEGGGWAFTKVDFVAEFGEVNIHQALSSLARVDKIRHVSPGVFCYRYLDDRAESIALPEPIEINGDLKKLRAWHDGLGNWKYHFHD